MSAAAGLTFINHIMSAGFIVAAPPANPFFREIHQGLGCEIASHAVHYDYDGVTSTPYYVIDTRGNKLLGYLNKRLESFGIHVDPSNAEEEFAVLTLREKEVVDLIMKSYTNMEIAGKLYLSEVTVKKHLTNIFRKLAVTNRNQLILKYKV
ncbi:CsgBAC operon transcriptional regulatory protein [compost metagenome]